MYFVENMTINEISKTCKETDAIITAILFNARQKVLRIFSEFDIQKVKAPKSLLQAFMDEEELIGMKNDGISEDGVIFIIENAFEVEALHVSTSGKAAKSSESVPKTPVIIEKALEVVSSHVSPLGEPANSSETKQETTVTIDKAVGVEASHVSPSVEAAKSSETVQKPAKFPDISLSKFEDAALGKIPLTDRELRKLREKIVECKMKVQVCISGVVHVYDLL